MRGGKREGAGRKSTWDSGVTFEETTTIRVPAYLAEQLLDLAHQLDAGNVEVKIVHKRGTSKGQLRLKL